MRAITESLFSGYHLCAREQVKRERERELFQGITESEVIRA